MSLGRFGGDNFLYFDKFPKTISSPRCSISKLRFLVVVVVDVDFLGADASLASFIA